MTRIVTRLFDNFFDAQHAVVELERIGIPRGDISLVTSNANKAHAPVHVRDPRDRTAGEAAATDAGVGAATGGVIGAAAGVLAGLGLVAIPGLGPVIAAGWLASAAAGAVVGGVVVGAAGGVVGALTHAGVSEEEAHVYAEAVRRGATLVSAKVADDKLILAERGLAGLPAVDVAARGASYRASGWTRYVPEAPAYTEDEAVRERARYVVRESPPYR
jgi:hypothetical protein